MQLPSSRSSTPNLNNQPTAPFSLPMPMPMPGAGQQDGDFNLRQFLGMLRRRIIIVGVVAGVSMLFTINSLLNQTPIYKSSFRLLVEPVNADNEVPDLTSTENRSSGQGLDYETQIQVLRSPELIAKIVEQVQPLYPELDAGTLSANLNIGQLGETKLLEVSYESANPNEVQAVLEQAVQVYLRYSLAERQTNLRQGIQFVEKQLPSLQERVNALQDELQTFRQRYNFIDPDSQASKITSQTDNLEQRRQEVEQQLTQARFNLSALQGELGGTSALSEDTGYQQMVGSLKAIEAEIATELTRFQPQSLTIQVLEEKRQNLLPLLRREAERVLGAKLADAAIQLQALEVQQQAIAQAQAQVNLQTQQLPVLSRNYVDLQRELEIASASLNRFQTTRETLQIEAAQTEIPWQLIQAPYQPQITTAASINRSLLIGVLISAALGVGAAFALEKLDNAFHTVDELKAQTRLPILGALPLYKPLQSSSGFSLQKLARVLSKQFSKRKKSRRRRLVSTEGVKLDRVPTSSSFMEALRVLHTNLHLLGSSQPLRSIVVTSALPGDGKSTVAFHLAQTARAMGQKVLLVDTDLRRPQLHQWLNLPEQRGLSDIISGTVLIREVLVQPHPDADFFTLTAGTIPSDPAQLLASARMKQLMERLTQAFDLVIYDTPPLLGLADTNLLASHTDGVLLVVRLNKTDRVAFKQALENLKVSQIPLLGLVANGLQHQSFDFYSSYGYRDDSTGHSPEQSD